MKTLSFFLLLSLCLGACAGGKSSDGKSLDDCPEVADFRQASNDPVLVVQLDKVKDTLDLPLSRLLDDFRIVPLDNREEALTKGEFVTADGNYVGMGGIMKEPYRLFDREGRFVCQVGAIGQGPGEYGAVYDSSVDEAHDRVYLMPWNAKSLLVYNLKGEYLSSIPLPTLVPKGVFSVDTEKRLLTVGLLPFANIEGASVVWQQDFEGNVLHRVSASSYAVVPDFSNEVASNRNSGDGVFDFSIFHWLASADSLYHFLPEENRLVPVVTLQQPQEKIQQSYVELPGHYLIDIPTGYTDTQFGTYVSQRLTVLVDKQTRKGAYVRILNDLIGGVPVEYAIFYFKHGHFAYTVEPGLLLEHVEAALACPETLSGEQKKALEALKARIHENDNNYLFIGKIKQDADLSGLQKNVRIAGQENGKAQQTAVAEDTATEEPTDTVVFRPPYIGNYQEYYRSNNRFKDWKGKEVMTMVGAVIERDGTPHNLRIIRSCGHDELDREAIRLVEEADITPATNEAKQPVRCTNFAAPVYFPPR